MKLILTLLLLALVPAFSAPKAASKLTPEAAFTKTVQPFLANNCVGCHNPKNKTANLDLQQFTSIESVRSNLKVWRKVVWKLEQGEMPPAKFPQPKAITKKAVLKWVNAELADSQISLK